MIRQRLRPALRNTALLVGLTAAAAAALGHASGGPPDEYPGSRVTVELRVAGDLFATAAADSDPVRQPIALAASFDFSERAAAAAGPRGVARRYRTATATIDAAGRQTERRLAADAADLLVALEGTTPIPYMATGFLAREEIELLEVPFDPLLTDGLRPAEAVALDDSWTIDADLAAGLLAIDAIESGGLKATLEGVAAGTARIRLSGTIVDGVPTRLKVKGTATAAATATEPAAGWRIDGRVTDLEITIAERREAGWVSPGLEVEATVVMHRSAADDRATADSESTADHSALAESPVDRPQGEGRPGAVWHRHPGGRYAIVLDRRWRVVEDGPEGLVMRLVDRGALLAQCSILALPRTKADSPPGEETVRDDVRRSLAGQFGQFVDSEAVGRDDGTRVVRVVADGSADERPFRWIHHVLTGPEGHGVAVTVMLEPALADRFAAADRQLAAGVLILPDPPARSAGAPQGDRR
jgi:hypothetical protein